MKCERCNKEIEGTMHRFIFVEKKHAVWKNLCNDCYHEVLKKQGEKRTEKEYRQEWLEKTRGNYNHKQKKDGEW